MDTKSAISASLTTADGRMGLWAVLADGYESMCYETWFWAGDRWCERRDAGCCTRGFAENIVSTISHPLITTTKHDISESSKLAYLIMMRTQMENVHRSHEMNSSARWYQFTRPMTQMQAHLLLSRAHHHQLLMCFNNQWWYPKETYTQGKRCTIYAIMSAHHVCSGKRKELSRDSSDEDSGNDTEDEKRSSKWTVAAKFARAPKKNKMVRKNELEADKWTLDVKEKSVLCKGCNEWKELHRVYEIKDWERHKKICAGITGKKKVRVWNPVLPPVKAVSL